MVHTKQGEVFTKIILETFKLSGLFTAAGDTLAKTCGLTSARWKILSAIIRSGHPLTVIQIAHQMGQTRQAVQRLVDLMHKNKLLTFENNPNHKRSKFINLSQKGHATYQRLEARQIPWANEMSKDIPIEDLQTTLATLNKLLIKEGN